MGVRILEGHEQGDQAKHTLACLFCSTTEVVFGPLFHSAEDAESFLLFCKTDGPHDDPRHYEPIALDALHTKWLRATGRIA